MGWWSKKSETDRSQPSQELVAQDPRTRVQTTSAATETTNTAVQNSTITDNNKQTVTFLTTRQTVTHTQRALITETTTRRTPSQAELEALFAKIKMGGEGPIGSTTTTTTTTSSRSRPPSLNGVSFRSTQPFKATASNAGKRSSTLVKTEQTTVTQKNGRTVTQHLETHRVDLKGSRPKATWASFASTANSSTSSYVSPYRQKPSMAITCTSPNIKTPKTTSSTSSSSASSITSPPKPSSSVSSISSIFKSAPKQVDKPLSSTATPKPFISLGSSGGTKPKVTAVAQSQDAQGTISTSLGISKSSLTKNKLKPARVYIFNHERFDNKNEFRKGSAQDVKVLRATFEQLKCKVEVITDATLVTIKKTVRMCKRRSVVSRLNQLIFKFCSANQGL